MANVDGEDSQEPSFSVEVLKSGAASGHGLLTCAAAGNSMVAVGTSKGFVVRHDFVNDDVSGMSPTYLTEAEAISDFSASQTPFLPKRLLLSILNHVSIFLTFQ